MSVEAQQSEELQYRASLAEQTQLLVFELERARRRYKALAADLFTQDLYMKVASLENVHKLKVGELVEVQVEGKDCWLTMTLFNRARAVDGGVTTAEMHFQLTEPGSQKVLWDIRCLRYVHPQSESTNYWYVDIYAGDNANGNQRTCIVNGSDENIADRYLDGVPDPLKIIDSTLNMVVVKNAHINQRS